MLKLNKKQITIIKPINNDKHIFIITKKRIKRNYRLKKKIRRTAKASAS